VDSWLTLVAKRTASAKKQARAGVRRAARNRAVRSEVKTKVVKARRSFSESPVAESDRASLAIDAIRSLDRATSKGILHRNNAARRKARLMRQLVKVGGAKVGSAKVAAPVKATGGKGKKAAPAPAPAPAAAASAKKTKK
jgi:small subunit ribosomal protein S20